jgi:hypothetical protein
MSSSIASKRCSACVRSGRTCRWELHSDFEWDELENLEKENEKQLDSVISSAIAVGWTSITIGWALGGT